MPKNLHISKKSSTFATELKNITNKTNKVMKKISKKEFKSLIKSVACALITCQKNQLISDTNYINSVWQDIAITALLEYPQEDIAKWQMLYNYLQDFCKTI